MELKYRQYCYMRNRMHSPNIKIMTLYIALRLHAWNGLDGTYCFHLQGGQYVASQSDLADCMIYCAPGLCLGLMGGRRVMLTTSRPAISRLSRQSGTLNIPQPYRDSLPYSSLCRQPHGHLSADCLDKVRSSTSHSPTGIAYLTLVCVGNLTALSADCLDKVGSSTSHSPTGITYLTLVCVGNLTEQKFSVTTV
jgi:hypothetical protein